MSTYREHAEAARKAADQLPTVSPEGILPEHFAAVAGLIEQTRELLQRKAKVLDELADEDETQP